jgi:hypothetical protein
MDFSRFTDPNAYKQALAGLLRRGGEVTDFIATAPEKAGQAILEGHERNKQLQAQAFANPNRPFQVTNQQAMTELGDRMLAGPLSVAPVGMIAYHGTPHLIKDKFDINKVGTGEGAQAYGHGMYFAESPEVAKTYRQQVVDANALNANSGKSYNSVQDFFDDIAVDKGNLYKVDIPDAYVPNMMNWDKPLSQQPKSVQDALAKIDPDSYSPKGIDYDPSELGQAIYHRLSQKSDEPLRREWVKKRDMLLEKGIKNNPELEAHLLTNPNPYQVGSQLLNEYGIKGIRYSDQASRGQTTQGTSNFVVFDPTDVKLLERNNQPISRKELLQEQIDKLAQ